METIQDSKFMVLGVNKVQVSVCISAGVLEGCSISFYLEAWQQHLQSGESQLAFLVLLAFCCLISAVAQLCLTLCNPMDCSTPGFPVHPTNSWNLLKLMSIESVMPSNHLIFCCPLLLLPLIFPSIRVFSNESVLHIRWPKYWSFSISPSNEYSGLISFRMDWFDLFAVHPVQPSAFPRIRIFSSESSLCIR